MNTCNIMFINGLREDTPCHCCVQTNLFHKKSYSKRFSDCPKTEIAQQAN